MASAHVLHKLFVAHCDMDRNWLIERHMLVSLIFVNVDALTIPCGVGDVSIPWQPEQSYIILCG